MAEGAAGEEGSLMVVSSDAKPASQRVFLLENLALPDLDLCGNSRASRSRFISFLSPRCRGSSQRRAGTLPGTREEAALRLSVIRRVTLGGGR